MINIKTTHTLKDKEKPLEVILGALKQPFNISDLEGSMGDNARYGGIVRGKLKVYQYPCHHRMRYLKGAGIVFSNFVHPVEEKLSSFGLRPYFKWLTGPRSPWASVFSMGMSSRVKKPDMWWNHGFIFDRVDHLPANLLHNFLVASRVPKEWPMRIRTWNMLTSDKRVDPAVAFALTGSFDTKSMEYPHTFIHGDPYDFPLNNGGMPDEAFINFVGCRPNYRWFRPPLTEVNDYTPVNAIWYPGQMKKDFYTKRPNFQSGITQRYAGHLGRARWAEGGEFNDRKVLVNWRLTNGELSEIARQETKRVRKELRA